MSASIQIIQRSGEDTECTYNTELFIVDSSAEQNNSGLIYIMRMKSSPLSRNITLIWHSCLYFSSLSNKAALGEAQKWYQSDARSRQWKVYTQCIALHIICDPGTINSMMKSDINIVYVTLHEWWESCAWKMNYRKAIMSTVSISLSWLTSMSEHRPTQDARVRACVGLNWAMSCWCTFQSNNFWSQLFRRDLSSHKLSTNNEFLQFGRGGCVLDLIW